MRRPLVDPRRTAAVQTINLAAMPETVQVKRTTRTTDNAGGKTRVLALIAVYPGRVALVRSNSREAEIADRLSVAAAYTISVPAGADIRNQDVLVVLNRTFQVQAAMPDSWEAERRVLCVEVTSA